MSACDMGSLCCGTSPCAYLAVDANAEELAALKREVERLRGAIHNLRGIPDGARLCEVSLDAYCEAQKAAGPLAHKEPGDEG